MYSVDFVRKRFFSVFHCLFDNTWTASSFQRRCSSQIYYVDFSAVHSCSNFKSCKKGSSETTEKQNILSDENFNGFWHDSPFIAAWFQDGYQIYPDHWFKYSASEYDTENRVLYISGTLEIKDNMLCLVISEKRMIMDGEFKKVISPFRSLQGESCKTIKDLFFNVLSMEETLNKNIKKIGIILLKKDLKT